MPSSKILADVFEKNEMPLLEWAELSYDFSEEEGAIATILDGLKKVKSLKMLTISDSVKGNAELQVIGDYLAGADGLQELSLSWDDDLDVSPLAKGIAVSHLKTLDLSNVELRDEGMAMITDALIKSASMQMLYLSNTNITVASSTAICSLIQKLPSLANLILHHNRLRDGTADAIANVIASNKTLRYLSLAQTDISELAAARLMTTAKDGGCPVDIKFGTNKFNVWKLLSSRD
jgi:Ran GTPase-activating protein (RanGAP) involved in mRNA processing and transport